MTESDELALFKEAWQSGTERPPNDLYRTVVRHTWLIRAEFAGSGIVTVVFLGGTAWKAAVTPSAEYVALAIWVWIVTAAGWYFSIRNWAGLRTATGFNANDYLTLSICRCQAALAANRAGLWMLLVQCLFLGAWHAWYWSHHRPVPSLSSWLIASCLPLGFLFALLLLRNRQHRELQRLEAMRQQLTD